MSLTWVIGSGGLLGASLVRASRAAGHAAFEPAQRWKWAEPGRLNGQIAQAVAGFAVQAAVAGRWQVYWAAGIGTMASTGAELAPESAALAELLTRLQEAPALRGVPGTMGLASSAGAIHAGSPREVITEASQPSPTSAYARHKLEQEAMLREFAGRRGPGTGALLARFSTLYGVGQARGKAQGLISHVARQIVLNRPVHIYVPLDTIRDYLAVDDAAARWIAATDALPPDGGAVVRLIASERPTTIAEIVGIFRRLSRRRLPVVTSANWRAVAYSRCVQFRSQALPTAARPSLPLPVGVARVLAAERARHAACGP